MQLLSKYKHLNKWRRKLKRFMRRLLLLTIILAFISCSKEEETGKSSENGLSGKYTLQEQLTDPGDGSGSFKKVDSDRYIRFSGNLWESNGNLCKFSTSTENPSLGEINVKKEKLVINSCTSNQNAELSFEISGDTLFLNYQCIEPCAQLYLKDKAQ